MTRILIIEDDPAVAVMLEVTFALEGFETELVADGGAAVERLDGEPVDVVILDVMMPEVDGIAVLKLLRTRSEWDATSVVVATALTSDEDQWAGWSAGADYYLVKPFDLDHLRSVVQRLVVGVEAS